MNKLEMTKSARELYNLGILQQEHYAALIESIGKYDNAKIKEVLGVEKASVPSKSLEAQERCIELFGHPKDQYVLRKGQYIHRSVAKK